MSIFARIADKAGALGTIVSAMSCPACFPAIAGLGAALGLGFLSQYEELFITRLLPFFAVLVLLANALGWFSHRQWHRSVLGMIGPGMVIAASYFVFGSLNTALLYTGIGFMVVVSVWDLASPANQRCSVESCPVDESASSQRT